MVLTRRAGPLRDPSPPAFIEKAYVSTGRPLRGEVSGRPLQRDPYGGPPQGDLTGPYREAPYGEAPYGDPFAFHREGLCKDRKVLMTGRREIYGFTGKPLRGGPCGSPLPFIEKAYVRTGRTLPGRGSLREGRNRFYQIWAGISACVP